MALIPGEARGAGRRRIAIALAIVLALSIAACGRRPPEGVYDFKLPIAKAAGLSADERAVEARFAASVGQDPDKAIAAYRQVFGKEVNVDNARELSTDFAPDGPNKATKNNREHRTKYSDAVQEPARALATAVYLQLLHEPASEEPGLVVFTAGGAGSGKTTSIRGSPALTAALNTAQVVYDTTLSDAPTSVEKIEQALQAEKRISIVFVYRDPVEAFVDGALPRAMSGGRTMLLDAFVDTHLSAPDVLLALADKYKGDARVSITVLDNTGPAAVAADVEFLRGVSGRYDPDNLKRLLQARVGKALAEGGISEEVHKAFMGH
jgi:hypothetical protein